MRFAHPTYIQNVAANLVCAYLATALFAASLFYSRFRSVSSHSVDVCHLTISQYIHIYIVISR